MKIATKTLVTLLVITMLSLGTVNVSAAAPIASRQRDNRLEKLTHRHDRKLELRAAVLGITPDQLKAELKDSDFDTVLKHHGFKTREAFRTAIAGKLKDELKKRGWSDDKIQKFITKRFARLEDKN